MARHTYALGLLVLVFTVACSRSQPEDPVLKPFESGGLWGFRDGRGEVVIPPKFVVAREFSTGGVAAVVDGSEWIYIDRKGKSLLTPLVVDNGPDYFCEGLARLVHARKVGFFDERGRVVIEPRFDFALPFSEGLSAFCEGCFEESDGEHRRVVGGKWGFLDTSGRTVIPAVYEAAEPFSDGLSRVRVGGRWIRIDRRGVEQR
jgi:hypothetical protein